MAAIHFHYPRLPKFILVRSLFMQESTKIQLSDIMYMTKIVVAPPPIDDIGSQSRHARHLHLDKMSINRSSDFSKAGV